MPRTAKQMSETLLAAGVPMASVDSCECSEAACCCHTMDDGKTNSKQKWDNKRGCVSGKEKKYCARVRERQRDRGRKKKKKREREQQDASINCTCVVRSSRKVFTSANFS